MTPPTLTAPQRALLLEAASCDAIRLTEAREARPADRLVELGLLRDAPTPQGFDESFELKGRRLRVTVHGDALAHHLARVDLGLA